MTDIFLHEGQAEIYRDLFLERRCRMATAACARGWGKSYFAAVAALTAVHELMELPSNVPNKNVYIIAPTYDQVVEIYYPLLQYELGLEEQGIKPQDSGKFYFPNNVQLRLLSFEAIARMRGKGAYFVVNDEVSSWTKTPGFKAAWEGIIQPCIVTRWSPKNAARFGAKSPGRALTISTTKGYNFLHTMFNMPEKDPAWRSYHYDYKSSPYLDQDEIERIKSTIDPIEFASEYLAQFKDSGNNVFYCFDRKIHVRSDIPEFLPGEDVHIGIDFNVGLQCSSAFGLRGKQIHYLDEFKGHPDTEQLAIAIKGRYPNNKIIVYPDPTGNARKTSSPVGRTDFTILRGFGFEIRARSRSPGVIDSVNCVNRQLMTANGKVNMFFHPRVVGTITSMERTKWVDRNPDTATIDKSENLEHFSDNVRYSTEYLYPILGTEKKVYRGNTF